MRKVSLRTPSRRDTFRRGAGQYQYDVGDVGDVGRCPVFNVNDFDANDQCAGAESHGLTGDAESYRRESRPTCRAASRCDETESTARQPDGNGDSSLLSSRHSALTMFSDTIRTHLSMRRILWPYPCGDYATALNDGSGTEALCRSASAVRDRISN
jgi:hypothetical protein